jgi:demethylspheroidene O-methyltransferase
MQRSLTPKQQVRFFFSEEKKQKTFTSFADTARQITLREAKVFWFFLSKKNILPSLPAIVARPGFRRWAARFPFTRPVARAETRALFDICAGFVYAQILKAGLELRLFDILLEGPATAENLAPRLRLSVDAATRLLDGAVALKLATKKRHGRYGLAKLGAALVGNEAIAAMVAHHRMFYADLADPVALLRGAGPTQLSTYWAYARSESPGGVLPEQVAEYTRLMAASQPLVADEILDAYDVRRHRCLMDMGGGEGVFLSAAARRAPDLQLRLFDLPPVAERAAARFAANGFAARAQAVGGSFFHDSLPEGADLISLVRVVHDHDDDAVLQLFRAVHQALPRSGTLLLAEPMAGTKGAERMGDAYFGFYLLAMGSGRPRTAATLTAMLRACGFGQIRQVPTHTPLLTSVLIARPA